MQNYKESLINEEQPLPYPQGPYSPGHPYEEPALSNHPNISKRAFTNRMMILTVILLAIVIIIFTVVILLLTVV